MGEVARIENNRTIRQIQQSFADNLGYREEIIWDLLSAEQGDFLKRKIKELLRNPPDANERTKAGLENTRNVLFNSIWEQRKYTNGNSLTSIIYVMVATAETDANRVEQVTNNFSLHPVFRARRCLSERSGRNSDSAGCCMIFVDENGRVYQNWASFVEENELPAGIMVAPRNGIYQLDGDRVALDKYTTPAASTKKVVLGYLDTTTAIGGFGAACIGALGLFALPVAAPIMAVAGGVGLASAAWATARSGSQLVDRSQHEQSINVTDRAARGHWLGVAAGTVGLGAAGATTALASATQAGRSVGTLTQFTVNGMNISSIVLSGTGVANGALDLFLKYNEGDDVSTLDVLQLSASLFLFTHSVRNFRLASTIINETANARIAGYRETLSNNQRRSFDKISKETMRVRGTSQGKMDIIRNINEVPSRQQFNDMYRINRNLNNEGIRPAFAPDGGGIILNDQVTVASTAELRASVQHNQGPNILGQVTQPIPNSFEGAAGAAPGQPTTLPTRLLGPNLMLVEAASNEQNNFSMGARVLQLSSIVVQGVIIHLIQYGPSIFEHIINAESFEDVINMMADRFAPEAFNFIMNLTETFMLTMREDLHSVLRFFISTETVLYRIIKHILDEYSPNLDRDSIEARTIEILRAVKAYFLSLNPNAYASLLTKCDKCEGYFSLTKL